MTYWDFAPKIVNSRESITGEKGRKEKQIKANRSREIHLGDVGRALGEKHRWKQHEGNRTWKGKQKGKKKKKKNAGNGRKPFDQTQR